MGWPLLIRWGTAASMLLAATIPVTVAVMIRRYPYRRWVWTGVLALLAAVFAVNLAGGFTAPAVVSTWAAEVELARATCLSTPDGTAVLTTPPDPSWTVVLPCGLLTG